MVRLWPCPEVSGREVCTASRGPGQLEIALTHVILHITDVEGRGWHRQTQSVFLGNKDGLGETMFFHVAQGQLAAWHAGHHILSAEGTQRS